MKWEGSIRGEVDCWLETEKEASGLSKKPGKCLYELRGVEKATCCCWHGADECGECSDEERQ